MPLASSFSIRARAVALDQAFGDQSPREARGSEQDDLELAVLVGRGHGGLLSGEPSPQGAEREARPAGSRAGDQYSTAASRRPPSPTTIRMRAMQAMQ